MRNPIDRRHSEPDDDEAGSLDDYFPPAADRAPGNDPRRSVWQRLRTWLFNLIPVVLSVASALLVLYVLARTTGLG
jgi:hypothetical protein